MGAQIFKERYAIHENETWDEACDRLARYVAKAEPWHEQRWAVEEKFFTEINEGRFMPGGRIWYGAGRPQGQLLNCFVVPSEDSIEGWAKAVGDVMIITAKGGGVGVNLSPIRPRGSVIKGNGGVTTGSVSLMHAINQVGEVIVGGGGRRLALMLCLDVDHPDLEEFLNVKLNKKKLNNANISIVLNIDPREFRDAVKENRTLRLQHPNSEGVGEINARKLWNRIVRNAWKNGEPGVLNGWLANQQNNIWYDQPLVSTNPCGEIWLERYGCCDLGALVLPNFVRDGHFEWDQLAHSIGVGVRFLDNVLSVNKYPLPELEENCKRVRRIGLGVMGVHNMLLALGMKYSSPEAIAFLDKLFNRIKTEAYLASIDLAREKGAFPAFNEQMLESGFCQELPQEIKNGIRQFGMRNCAVLTIAPTGTTALVHGCSAGIEPLYAPVHIRTWWTAQPDGGKKFQSELVVDPAFIKYGDLCEGALDIPPAVHFEVQKTVQKHIDNAVSKTINLPNDIPKKGLAEVWLEYLPYCKGTTLYRDGSRVAYDDQGNPYQPMKPVPHDEVARLMKERSFVIENDQQAQNMMDCPDGVCEVKWDKELVETAA
jgi:ribonucleoside-diphosphate reductase alpha chain